MKISKGFTIIEVLISVIILASIATILYQISFKSKSNYIFYKKKYNFENISTLGLLHDIKSNTNLYEILRSEYKINDYEQRKFLKTIKIKKKIIDYSKIKLPIEDAKYYININQIQIQYKKNIAYYFSVGI